MIEFVDLCHRQTKGTERLPNHLLASVESGEPSIVKRIFAPIQKNCVVMSPGKSLEEMASSYRLYHALSSANGGALLERIGAWGARSQLLVYFLAVFVSLSLVRSLLIDCVSTGKFWISFSNALANHVSEISFSVLLVLNKVLLIGVSAVSREIRFLFSSAVACISGGRTRKSQTEYLKAIFIIITPISLH